MSSREEFLAQVLPPLENGETYCSWGNKGSSIKQRFAESLEGLSQLSDDLLNDSYNVFFALASFGPEDNGRYAANAHSLKSFFLDIDCGEGKPYADQQAGVVALQDFCRSTKLPRPTIVRSGRGVHVYWILNAAISRDEWKPRAEQLKQLCVDHGLEADPAVTSDPARILRVPGTKHLKDANNPLPVELVYMAPMVSVETMMDKLTPTEDVLAVLDKAAFKRPMDPTTLALLGNNQSRFNTIMKSKGCPQLTYIFKQQATIEEPLWRAGLSIAHHCVDREEGIHKLSRHHPDYNAEETERKAGETKGPYTCASFKKLNPNGCEGCTKKITSPIQLGREIVEATEEDNVVESFDIETKAPQTYVIPSYPQPYFRGKTGGIYIDVDEDSDVDPMIYPYDFYVVKRMTDPDMGEVILCRLHLPQDGVREFIMPLQSVMSKDRFIGDVARHGITVLAKQQDRLMSYIGKWVTHLQTTTKAEIAHKQFGWLENRSAIIVGDREIRATETVYSPPSNTTLPLVHMFQPKGDFHIWKDVINAYAREGMQQRAFGFFMGFGSLLMPFTNLNGFLLNLMSRESGSGKTTVLQAINSIYGRPSDLLLSAKDTYNHRMQRLGTMQNLCATIDEITNLPPEVMSNLCYDVTSGRGKNRMKSQENVERLNHAKWALGVVSSSNRSVPDSLLSIKTFPEGELMRILEMNIKPDTVMDATWSKRHFNRLADNYGHAIQPFSEALVAQLPGAMEMLNRIQERIDAAANIKSTERFWSAMAAIAITAGTIAKNLGLHDIPIQPVFEYSIQLIKESRQNNREAMFDMDDFLGAFLQKNYQQTLVINHLKDARTGLEHGPLKEPHGALNVRYEPDTKLLYVVVRSYREECARSYVNMDESLQPYRKSGALVDIKKKRMTAGTVAATAAPTRALCFDTTKLDFFDEKVLIKDEDIERAAAGAVGEV